MTVSRRLGLKNSAVRAAIIEAAAEILSEKGLSELISPKIAERAGVKVQLVHYYFRTMDDLMIALTRHTGDQGLVSLAELLAGKDPLRAMWDRMSDMKVSALEMEFVAAATHRKAMRDEAARYGEQSRKVQAEAIARHFQMRGLEAPVAPVAIAFIVTAVTRLLSSERMFGMSLGHREVMAVMDGWRNRFVGKAKKNTTAKAPKSRTAKKSVKRSKGARKSRA